MVTIKDIAKHAKVSVTTVSRALNGYYDVSEATRNKIQTIADSLGYSPNMAARSLISKKTKTLGLLLSNITRDSSKDNIAYEVLCGINDKAGELDYDLVLFSTTTQKQQIKSYRTVCQERGVDGVIIMGIRLDDPYLSEIVLSEIPCVLIDIKLDGPKVHYITSDNYNGSYQATEHLIQHGHRHIALINGHDQADVSRLRFEGYKDALAAHQIPFNKHLIKDGNFSENGGYDCAVDIVNNFPDVTAIFCISDLMALGVLKALKELGKRVPEDISIIGFDNISTTEYSNPPLSTIHQQKYEIGSKAAELLISLLEGNETPRSVMLPTQLVERQSVASIR